MSRLLLSEELRDYLVGDHAINKIFTLGNAEFPVSWENEIKLWTFLETRAALLLKTYKSTSEVQQRHVRLLVKFITTACVEGVSSAFVKTGRQR